MRARIKGAAIIVCGLLAAALNPSAEAQQGSSVVWSSDDTFWRLRTSNDGTPSDDLAFKIGGNAIEISSHCFAVGLAFAGSNGDFHYSNDFMSSTSKSDICAPQHTSFAALADKIRRARSFELKNETLELRISRDRDPVILRRIHSGGIEYRWLKIVSYSDGGTQVIARSLGNVMPEMLLFGGMVGGTPGCGGFTGRYSLSGSNGVHIDTSAILAGMCENLDAAWQQDDDIIKNLDGESKFQRVGNKRFILRDKHGNVRAILEQK